MLDFYCKQQETKLSSESVQDHCFWWENCVLAEFESSAIHATLEGLGTEWIFVYRK